MDPDLRALARANMTFNAPLADARATELVELLSERLARGGQALDLGAGWGELLLRILAACPRATGRALDVDSASVARGRTRAAELGVSDRVVFVEEDATALAPTGDCDAVICVGASHAWGGTRPMLDALRAHVAPTGGVLVGDAFWASPPTDELRAFFGDLPDLAGLRASFAPAGLHPLELGVSSLEEWDAFEEAGFSGLERAERDDARRLASERRARYERGYRGTLGFAWALLEPR